jgi:hypothetical protein
MLASRDEGRRQVDAVNKVVVLERTLRIVLDGDNCSALGAFELECAGKKVKCRLTWTLYR